MQLVYLDGRLLSIVGPEAICRSFADYRMTICQTKSNRVISGERLNPTGGSIVIVRSLDQRLSHRNGKQQLSVDSRLNGNYTLPVSHPIHMNHKLAMSKLVGMETLLGNKMLEQNVGFRFKKLNFSIKDPLKFKVWMKVDSKESGLENQKETAGNVQSIHNRICWNRRTVQSEEAGPCRRAHRLIFNVKLSHIDLSSCTSSQAD